MKHNVYRDAVEHLEFSDRLHDAVMNRVTAPKRSYRMLRMAAIAAVIVCLMATTVFATSSEFRTWTISLLNLGNSRKEMKDATTMEFTHEEAIDGVSIYYMELDKDNYFFVHGMLSSPQTGYLHVTEDYQLVPMEMKQFTATLKKNGRVYKESLNYVETEAGIISSIKSILSKNEDGEIFLNSTDGNSNQWPVYVNFETGEIRDALPDWTEDDFSGRICYSWELKDGILISTLDDANPDAGNNLYWVGKDAEEAVEITLPEQEYGWYCENGELYSKNVHGHLFKLNDDFEFELLYAYETGDDLTNGLYTVATEEGKLAIIDVYRSQIYEIPECFVDPGKADGDRSRTGWDIDETMGYNATRYDSDGRIALVQTELRSEEKRVALCKLGILNEETGELKLLEIENDYDGYTINWLDENRLAVIYDEQYLCIYEFE